MQVFEVLDSHCELDLVEYLESTYPKRSSNSHYKEYIPKLIEKLKDAGDTQGRLELKDQLTAIQVDGYPSNINDEEFQEGRMLAYV